MRKFIGMIVFVLFAQICSAASINVPADQPTIQDGIDAAIDGDTVLIAPGTYSGEGNVNLQTDGQDIVIKGEFGPDNTIIDCGGWRGFFMDVYDIEDSNTVIEGLTIANGEDGIVMAWNCPKLLNLRFVNNNRGINIRLDKSNSENITRRHDTLYLRHCEFIDNAEYGVFGGSRAAPMKFENCLFSGATMIGVYLEDSFGAKFNNCSFIGVYRGIHNIYFPSSAIIDSCYFDSAFYGIYGEASMTNSTVKNCVVGIGGYSFSGTTYSVYNCLFEGNTGAALGAAIGTITNSVIRNNPGYIAIGDGDEYEQAFTFKNCRIFNNIGGISGTGILEPFYLLLDSCIYHNNAGPISVSNRGGMIVKNSTFAYNSSDVIDIGYWTSSNYTFSIQNSIIVNNNGRGINVNEFSTAEVTVICSDLYNNAGGNFVGVENQIGQNGNISENPLFCEGENPEYNIALSSPCAPANNSCDVTMGAGAVVDCQPAHPYGIVLNVPEDYPTIQSAIDAAYNGDTVLIAPGTYSGEGNIMLSTRKKAIIVRGSDGPDNTIIDCQDSIGFYIVNFESPYEFGSTIIEDMTIWDGRRGMVLSYAWPTLRNIKFINHSERGLSYEFFEQKSKETRFDIIHNCVFDSCAIGAISELGSVEPEFRNCTFSNCNRGVHKFYYAVFEVCSFIDNYYGLLQDDWDFYSIDSCLFEGNHAGIVEGNSGFDITNTRFGNGSTAIMAGFSYGHFTTSNCIFENMYGTVICGMREAEITDCIFRNNTGLVFYMDGVSIDEPSEGIIKNCQIYGNNNILTQKYFGNLKVKSSVIVDNTGGIEIQYPVDNQIIMDSCIYARNGEPLFFKTGYDSRLELNYCTVVENAGGGIDLDNQWGGPAQINNSIIALNTGHGLSVSITDSINQITISCSDFYSNFNGNYHYIADQTGLNGNISENPLFCEGENPEYNIALSSPCAPANNSCGVTMGAGQVVDCQPVYPPVAVISIDRSGSMFYTDPLGRSRLERAKTLAHSEIDKLLTVDDPDYPGVYEVAVQYFNASGIVLLQDYTSDPLILHNAIDSIPEPRHDTPLAAAMCQAHCLVSEMDYPEKYVLTFTDGLENESQNFDLCSICDPCNELVETGWNFNCDPNNPASCTEWQLCLAEQFSASGVNLVHYFGEPINPFDKSKNYDGLEDMYFLKSAAEESMGIFSYHSDLEIEGYLPGDANSDNLLNISDAVYLINFVFSGGEAPDPYQAGDYNLDGLVNVSDAVGIIRYVFAGE